MRSNTIKMGIDRSPHRALLKATGVSDSDMHKPFIGVCNSYIADELFMVGTANEVIPINSVDGRMINGGKVGLITEKIQSVYNDIVCGKNKAYKGYLDTVSQISVLLKKEETMKKSDVEKLIIFDTTLRDGEQSPGASLKVHEKLEIAHFLKKLNVDVLEAGFPVASKGDFEAVKLIASEVEGPTITALARAIPADIERAAAALEPAPKKRIHTFIATSDIHLEYKLKMSCEAALKQAVKAVKLAKSFTNDVEFSAEDAARTGLSYLTEVIEAVIEAGATTINIPDTVGYTVPLEFGAMISSLKNRVRNIDQAVLSVHCHNDLGLAVANSLSAISSGARQVECAMNGIGERAGNCALEELVMALKLRQDIYSVYTDVQTEYIYETSQLVSSSTGLEIQPNKAIVGRNAFAHEAGIHQHGVLANKQTYEIMKPEDVGVPTNSIVLGKHSGKHAFRNWLTEHSFFLNEDDFALAFEQFIALCDDKKYLNEEDILEFMEHFHIRTIMI